MKGPFERVKYDLLRVWECPLCKRRERWPGHITYRLCHCQSDATATSCMQLLHDGIRRRPTAATPQPS